MQSNRGRRDFAVVRTLGSAREAELERLPHLQRVWFNSKNSAVRDEKSGACMSRPEFQRQNGRKLCRNIFRCLNIVQKVQRAS